MRETDDYGIKATATSDGILDAIQNRNGATLTEIADQLPVSKSAVHKHLATLESLGYVVRSDDEYQIGLRLFRFGIQARNASAIYGVGKPHIAELANLTGEQACLVVPEDGESGNCIYVYTASPDENTVKSQEGTAASLHSTAGGKAILSSRDDEDVDEYLSHHGLSSETANTITDRSEFESQLQSIRDRGVAFDQCERSPDLRGVASPIRGEDGRPLGAVEILGSADRLSGKRLEEDTVGLVLSSARRIESDLAPD